MKKHCELSFHCEHPSSPNHLKGEATPTETNPVNAPTPEGLLRPLPVLQCWVSPNTHRICMSAIQLWEINTGAKCCVQLQKHSWSLTNSCLKTSLRKTHIRGREVLVTASKTPLGNLLVQGQSPSYIQTSNHVPVAVTQGEFRRPLGDLMGSEVKCQW